MKGEREEGKEWMSGCGIEVKGCRGKGGDW